MGCDFISFVCFICFCGVHWHFIFSAINECILLNVFPNVLNELFVFISLLADGTFICGFFGER